MSPANKNRILEDFDKSIYLYLFVNNVIDSCYGHYTYIWERPTSCHMFEDRVLLTTDAEGMKVYKIITRQTRRPEVGHFVAEWAVHNS